MNYYLLTLDPVTKQPPQSVAAFLAQEDAEFLYLVNAAQASALLRTPEWLADGGGISATSQGAAQVIYDGGGFTTVAGGQI